MKSGSIQAKIRKIVSRMLLLIWLMLCLPIQLVWSQLPQHSMYLNNEIKFERVGIEQGLANNSATYLMQDQQGFIWFATTDGLTKYDGYTFTLYQNNPRDTNSLADNSVNAVYEDRSGLIWVGLGGSGGVNSFDPVTGIWKRYVNDQDNSNSISNGVIHAILEDRAGMFWFASLDEGLTRYDPKTGQFTRFQHDPQNSHSLSNDRVSALLEDKAGRLWVGTGSGLDLFDSNTNSFSHIVGDLQDSITFKSSDIHHIYEDKQGDLWLSTNGVYVLDPDAKKYKAHYFMDPNQPNSLANNVHAVVQDREGNYWTATKEGLYRFDLHTGHFKLYENKEYLPKDVFIHDLLVDQSGLVWLGTIGTGAYYFFPQPWKFRRYLNEAHTAFGKGSNQIQSIFKASDGELYVTTSSSLLRCDSTQAVFSLAYQVPSTKENVNDYFITSSCEEKPGVFWLGTIRNGIIRFDAHSGKAIYIQHDSLDSESLASNIVDVLFKDSQGIIWIGSGGGQIGTDGGQLQWYDAEKNKFVRFDYLSDQPDHSLPGHGIRFIHEDKQGDLWIGVKGAFLYTGGGGIYHVNRKAGKIVHYNYQQGQPNSLSSNAITCLYEDKQGIFWLGSYGAGVTKLDTRTGKTTIYTKEDGLQSNTIHAISGDSSGNLWLLASEGITRFNPASLKADLFDFKDGLGGSPVGMAVSIIFQAGATLKSEDGTIYFGSNNGLTVFHPDRIKMNQFKPPLAITEFNVAGESPPFRGKEITLAHHQNFFDIEFVALNFFSSGKNQYAYKLEGLDKDWVFTGTQREARYTNVSPGKYTFRVKGSNNDGVWNEEGTSLAIIIHPPWWQTTWAYLLYVMLFLASVWGFIEYRSKSLRREKKILEHKVSIRTHELKEANEELSQQKEEIAAQHEQVAQTLKDLQATQAQLIQKEKMASLGELTAGIAHEIQNPLNFVNNFAEVSSELAEELQQELNAGKIEEGKAISEDIKQSLKKIHHHGRRAESIVKSMLQHSRASSGERQFTDINALADEYLRLSYHGLRAKDKDFNAQLTTDFDEAIGKVEVVPQELGRVLLNLYNNAFYATEQKQKITQNGYQPEVKVSTRRLANKIEISVRDNGTGMSEAVKQKVFQPFFTTKPTGEGTGLGLSLSYDIITKAHQGEIKVESKEGEYSKFVIVLPYGK